MNPTIEMCLVKAELCETRASASSGAAQALFAGLARAWRLLADDHVRERGFRDCVADFRKSGKAAKW